jgi:hypothetical protein
MEPAASSEMLVLIYQVTRGHIPEYSNFLVPFLYCEVIKTSSILVNDKVYVCEGSCCNIFLKNGISLIHKIHKRLDIITQ